MRVAGFDYMDIADTDGIALAVFFSGCCHHCKGCHNPQLQDFSYGEDYDVMDLLDKLITDYNKGDYDYIVFSGGDPLCQDHDYIRYLLMKLTEQGIKVWIYTGYDYDAEGTELGRQVKPPLSDDARGRYRRPSSTRQNRSGYEGDRKAPLRSHHSDYRSSRQYRFRDGEADCHL